MPLIILEKSSAWLALTKMMSALMLCIQRSPFLRNAFLLPHYFVKIEAATVVPVLFLFLQYFWVYRALTRSSFSWAPLTRRSFPKWWAALMQALIFWNVSGALASTHGNLPRSSCALKNMLRSFCALKKNKKVCYWMTSPINKGNVKLCNEMNGKNIKLTFNSC